MSKIKLNHVIACAFILAFVVSSSAVKAQVDGMAGIDTVEDKAVVIGTVTKDITDRNNIFAGSYADGLTYELEGFSLWSGEIYDSSAGDSSGYGNISFCPAYVHNDYYNSSGLLRLSKWTETDLSSVLEYSISTIDDVSDTLSALRVTVNADNLASVNAYLIHEFTIPQSIDRYFLFGMKIYEETLNVSYAIRIRLIDSSQQELFITLVEDSNDWLFSEHSVSTERVLFDDDTGDVIFFQMKISDWDAQVSSISMSAIQKVSIQFYTSAPVDGVFIGDIFAMDFVDSVAKAGVDRNDELTAENDYVVLNITDPSVPYLKVRELDSHITRVNDAQIDFVYLPSCEEVYSFDEEQETYSVSYDYQIQIDTEDDWADEVSFSGMQLYYVLGADDSVYTSFIYAGSEKSSLLLNEGKGDAILLDTIVEDTIYLLRIEKALSQTEYDLAVGNASGSILDELYLALIALGIAILGFIPAVKNRLENKRREKLTEMKNRGYRK